MAVSKTLQARAERAKETKKVRRAMSAAFGARSKNGAKTGGWRQKWRQDTKAVERRCVARLVQRMGEATEPKSGATVVPLRASRGRRAARAQASPELKKTRAAGAQLQAAIDGLLRDALGMNLERIRNIKGRDEPVRPGHLSELRELLHLDEGAFSNWRTGGARAERMSKNLFDLLTSGTHFGLERAEPESQTFALEVLRWWRRVDRLQDVLDAVALLRDHLNNIHATQNKDATEAAAEVRAGIKQAAAALQAPSDFVVNPLPATLPAALVAERPIRFRDAEVGKLMQLLMQWTSAHVWITGDAGAGKSAALQLLATEVAAANSERDLAYLYVDLSTALRPSRAFYHALGVTVEHGGQLYEREVAEGAGAETDVAAVDNVAMVLNDIIRPRLLRNRLITFIEKYWVVAGDPANEQELRAVLESGVGSRAFHFIESHGEQLASTQRSTSVRLAALEAEQAQALLVEYGQQAHIAAAAVDLLDGELLLPGPLLQGALTFDPILTDGQTPEPLDLAIEIETKASEYALAMLRRLCVEHRMESEGAIRSMMAMSAFPGVCVSERLLARAGLDPVPWAGLRQVRWLDREQRLCGFGLQAIQAACTRAFNESDQSRVEMLRAAVLKLASALLDDEDAEHSRSLDAAVAWLTRNAPRERDLLSQLKARNEVESCDDPISPLPPQHEEEAAAEFLRRGEEGDLIAALAGLVVNARHRDAGTPPRRADFLDALQATLAAVQAVPALSSADLHAFDVAIFRGGNLHNAFAETARVGAEVVGLLTAQAETALREGDERWLAAWLSLLINVANQSLSSSRRATDAAQRLLQQIGDALTHTGPWKKQEARRCWLTARFALLRERIAPEAEKRGIILEGVAAAAECLRLTPQNLLSVRFYLRMVQRIERAEKDDAGRAFHVDAAAALLRELYGDPDGWNVGVRAQLAALMRDEAKRAWNQKYQGQRLQQALALLLTERPDGPLEVRSDFRAALVQARLEAALGHREAALECCNASIAINPTANAWLLKLRLSDEAQAAESWAPGGPVPIGASLRAAIGEFESWIGTDQIANNVAMGRVLVWIAQRRWRSFGSIERSVARQMEAQEIDYATLPREKKLMAVTAEYNRRNGKLAALEKRFGASTDSVLARFGLRAQLMRTTSVITGEAPKPEEALRVIDEALDRWPNNHLLQLKKAEYQRFTWQHDDAADGLRAVIATAPSGDIRRLATASLARTLHARAAYPGPGAEPDASVLQEAQALISGLLGISETAVETAVLRDHVAFELGEYVDWSRLDEMYDKIVATIEGFPTALFNNLDSVRAANDDSAPSSIADVLSVEFASPEVLGLTGTLWMRRAERGDSNDRLGDLVRAAACFYAQATMERSFEGVERAATSFRIGRVIVAAAEIFGALNPIPGLALDRKPDQLALAEAKFASAVGRSTGDFREVARQYQSRAARLGAQLRHE